MSNPKLVLDGSTSQFERKPSGHILIDDIVVADTVQCCHCNAHFISIKGSGVTRGFCFKCMSRTCGSAGCDICVAFERKLDLYERGRLDVLR